MRDMQRLRRNTRYLPDAEFPGSLQPTVDLAEALSGARDVLIAVPSSAFRATLAELEPRLDTPARIAWASKGFELTTGLLPHQVAHEVCGDRPGAVLSGPTFAREVGAGLPTAMTVASRDESFAKELALRLSGPHFRAYTQSDIMGVEVGGAVKNVIAIGSGIADGMGFGANTRVALITRGLAEMTRLGVQLGAQRDSATWCSPAPTISPATGGWDWRSAGANRSRTRRPASVRWWRACPLRARCARSPGAPALKCPFASRSSASCTKGARCAARCRR
jgi:glycerol-3-phosphate dehydrogenase (NAD(P)+)